LLSHRPGCIVASSSHIVVTTNRKEKGWTKKEKGWTRKEKG
jgi:hypothetical protein